MFRNYLASALRNLARNRLYAGVTIAGLAIGFAAALLIGVYVRQELSFDRFIPGHERVYLVGGTLTLPGARKLNLLTTPTSMATALKETFPEIQSVARLQPWMPVRVQRGEIHANESNLAWADPAFFEVLPFPAVAGELRTALTPADAVVLTRTLARKYFGRDAPLGEVLQINGRPYRVTAVLQDLPPNSHLAAELFMSSNSAVSPISQFKGLFDGPLNSSVATYFRLKPGASAAGVEAQLPELLATRFPIPASAGAARHAKRTLFLVPLAKVHLTASDMESAKVAADPAVLGAVGLVAVLIVVVAGLNFVTLTTARAARRAVEVGVRKAAGASRRDLIIQFMGEAFLQVFAAALVAVALAELLSPAVGALLRRPIKLDYLHDPALGLAIVGVTLATALLAGAYPAFVLSSFRPAAVLKGGPVQAGGAGRVREILVVAQFAVLIGLILAAATITRQTLFGLQSGGRVDKSDVFFVMSQPCIAGLRDQVGRLAGVRTAACVSSYSLALGAHNVDVRGQGRTVSLALIDVDFGFFEVFGVRPLAGRLFERSRPSDAPSADGDHGAPVIANESALRRLGLPSTRAAVGATVIGPDQRPATIIGVVPDFTLGSLREPIAPTLYTVGATTQPTSFGMVIKLADHDRAATLAEIDRLGRRYAGGQPPLRGQMTMFTLRLYLDTIIQAALIGAAGLVALTIAALGLFALSAYTTERRTKEIGVRKAMGASTRDILQLLIWQFTKPVLWAIVIGSAATWLLMRHWLSGFAYRVQQDPWTFLAVAAAALLIAWATVFAHVLHVARGKPVNALRYE